MKNVGKVLETFGMETTTKMVEILKSKSKIARGKLLESLATELKEGLEEIVLEFYMEDYGKWVDWGRRPGKKMPPEEAIEDWMEVKGIDKKYSFLIRRKIARDGIPAAEFFEIPLQLQLEILDAPLEEASRKDIIERVSEMVDKINKAA